MKFVSAALAAHLAEPGTTLAACSRISRIDAQEFFFTDHDRDLEFERHVYEAGSGYSRTAIANNASFGVDNLDVEGVYDSASITEQELRAGYRSASGTPIHYYISIPCGAGRRRSPTRIYTLGLHPPDVGASGKLGAVYYFANRNSRSSVVMP